MSTFQFHYDCTLPATARDACAFHTNANNLLLITPPWIDVTLMSMDDPMRENSQIELQIKRFGIPSVWKMRMSRLVCPETLVDEMIEGPFRTFHHQRKFKQIGNRATKMEETITVELPLGVLGKIFYPWIKKEMDQMFAYRHEAMQRHFDLKHKNK